MDEKPIRVERVTIDLDEKGFTKRAYMEDGNVYTDQYKLIRFGAKPIKLEIEDKIPDNVESKFDNVNLYNIAKAIKERQHLPPRHQDENPYKDLDVRHKGRF